MAYFDVPWMCGERDEMDRLMRNVRWEDMRMFWDSTISVLVLCMHGRMHEREGG